MLPGRPHSYRSTDVRNFCSKGRRPVQRSTPGCCLRNVSAGSSGGEGRYKISMVHGAYSLPAYAGHCSGAWNTFSALSSLSGSFFVNLRGRGRTSSVQSSRECAWKCTRAMRVFDYRKTACVTSVAYSLTWSVTVLRRCGRTASPCRECKDFRTEATQLEGRVCCELAQIRSSPLW